MNIKAIVYTSNTGCTAEYAKLLGEKTGLPVYSLKEADLPENTEIIYLGWLMASNVKGYKKAAKRYNVRIVCGVCLGTTGSQLDEVRKVNSVPENVKLFTLQGGYDTTKLRGIYKFMMKIVGKAIKKQILSKPEQTEDDRKIVDMLDHGGSAVDGKYLESITQLLQ